MTRSSNPETDITGGVVIHVRPQREEFARWRRRPFASLASGRPRRLTRGGGQPNRRVYELALGATGAGVARATALDELRTRR
jgi:hypothetical protein